MTFLIGGKQLSQNGCNQRSRGFKRSSALRCSSELVCSSGGRKSGLIRVHRWGRKESWKEVAKMRNSRTKKRRSSILQTEAKQLIPQTSELHRKTSKHHLTPERTDLPRTRLRPFIIYKPNKPTRPSPVCSPHPQKVAASSVSPVWACGVKSHPRHASLAPFKWKLDELLGSDPANRSN